MPVLYRYVTLVERFWADQQFVHDGIWWGRFSAQIFIEVSAFRLTEIVI